MDKTFKALYFATNAHEGQKRKGKDTPYIAHPVAVGYLLLKSGATEAVVIAGILHDTIEDTETTYEALVTEFGKDIAEIVNDVTEQDRSLPWIERKRIALEHVKDMRDEAVLVKTADAIHNMSDQIADYKKEGERMFERFSASKDQQLERYEKLVFAIEAREIKNPLLPMLKEKLAELESLLK